MGDILGADSLFAEIILAVGLALVAGNGFAIWKHHRGQPPEDAEGDLRAGRVWFLLAVGLVMTVWGTASVLA